MRANRSQIEALIAGSTNAAVQEVAKADEAISYALEEHTSINLVFSSSFLYRDKRTVKTNQSPRRLAARIRNGSKNLKMEEAWIADDLAFKANYRIQTGEIESQQVSIATAIGQELSAIGDLVFVLIGTVKGLRAASIIIEGAPVTELCLRPTSGQTIERLKPTVYTINRILPVEELLGQIAKDFEGEGGLTEVERRKIADAYDELLDGAVTDVAIPTGATVKPAETILGKIVSSLRSQTSEYRAALKAFNSETDSHAFNEVLRIAYNFSTDVLPLIYLFMSICDLKPIVFWCTVNKQWALYQAFAALPWSALGRKEKLDEYQSIVAQARNHAFHHVLPFEATVEVDLSGFDVRADRIRLFSAFGQKQERGIRLKDQELADVLADFSRAKERPVSKAFWEGNLRVMEAVYDLAQGILDALVLLHGAR